jgi:MFS family permease
VTDAGWLEEAEEALLEGDTRFAPGTARAALAHPVFRVLFFGAFLSNIGSWMQQIVLAAYAQELTGSAAYVGQLVFAQLGPILLLSIIGGTVADILDRRRMLMVLSVVEMAFAIGLAVVVASDDPSRLTVFLVALGAGIGKALFGPVYNAVLPGLVGMRDLAGAISLNSTQMNASRVIGPALGGIAFAMVGPSWVFLANAASFLFVIVALLRVRLPAFQRPPSEPPLRRLTGGFRIAKADRIVGKSLITITTFSFFCIVFVGMMPTFAAENLNLDVESFAYGAFYASFGLGAVGGSIANGTVLAQVDKAMLVRRGLAAYAVLVSIFAVLHSPALAFPVVILVGGTYFGMVTALNTTFQSRLAEHERGRALGLWMMGFGGTVGLANIVFGPVVDAIGMTPVLLFGGLVSLGLAWYADLAVPGEKVETVVSPALAD